MNQPSQSSDSVEVEREVIKLEEIELIEFVVPATDDKKELRFKVDPHEFYWKIAEWEQSDGLEGVALMAKLREEIGVDISMTNISRLMMEIVRVAELREDGLKKKLEQSRKEIAS